MQKFIIPSILVFFLLLVISYNTSEKGKSAKPKIIYIRADDLGYAELGCYGQGKIETPNIDALAKNGMHFTQHYSGVPVCAPSRCVLLTGNRVWEDLTAVKKDRWANIHFVQNGNETWMFNEHGELIISELSHKGFKEISRAKIIEPTKEQLPRGVTWSHPAFANKHVFIRNDMELVCVDLSE